MTADDDSIPVLFKDFVENRILTKFCVGLIRKYRQHVVLIKAMAKQGESSHSGEFQRDRQRFEEFP